MSTSLKNISKIAIYVFDFFNLFVVSVQQIIVCNTIINYLLINFFLVQVERLSIECRVFYLGKKIQGANENSK